MCVPLMHPLFFHKLLALLKMKCQACHEFRISRRQCRAYAAKLHLVDGGRVDEALALDEELAGATRRAGAGRLEDEEEKGGGKGGGEARREVLAAAARAVDRVLDEKLASTPLPDRPLALHERAARRLILKDFQGACSKAVKCANCRAFSPKIRHDQFNKVFRVALSARHRRANAAEGVKIRSACGGGIFGDEDGEDEEEVDSEDEAADDAMDDGEGLIDDEAVEVNAQDADGGGRKKKRTRTKSDEGEDEDVDPGKGDDFMNTLEVEAQVRLTWEKQPFLCRKYFGTAHVGDDDEEEDRGEELSDYVAQMEGRSGDDGRPQAPRPAPTAEAPAAAAEGHGLFFLRVVPVPPSRFRPPVVMAGMTVEHAQNHHLSQIIQVNAQLRTSFAAARDKEREIEEAKREVANDPSSDGAARLARLKSEGGTIQARSLATWVALQTAVNCLMDSTRDPAGQAVQNPGIRQLLEKKEGIFRKHMMGKRVNFACRSVISPDPYIGTNEIGLPLHFARTLTFPTPVTALNAKEMMELVRRGAHDYPGAVWVEFPNGKRVDLGKMKERGRNAIAARLLSVGGGGVGGGVVKVGRQLRDGDMVLMNRQVRS